MTTLIAKEMNSSKPAIKRAFCALTGSVLFEGDDILTAEKGISFAKSILPALEACLKSSSSTALTASGGPIEGYIAISVILGSFARSGKFGMSRINENGKSKEAYNFLDDVISRNAIIQSLLTSSTKPSFLLWDKVYQKITDVEDENWFLRACNATLQCFKSELAKSEILR